MSETLLPELRARINSQHIRDGQLFGTVPTTDLALHEQETLERNGWESRDYRDRPVMVAPELTIVWDKERGVFRDNMLHVAAHRFEGGTPAVGNAREILDELLDSAWEDREESLRTVLAAFSFASVLSGASALSDAGEPMVPEWSLLRVEGSETFFFYTQAMRDAARRAVQETVRAADDEDEVWTLIGSLIGTETWP